MTINPKEAEDLRSMASQTGLTRNQLEEFHAVAWAAAFPSWADKPWDSMSSSDIDNMFYLACRLGLEEQKSFFKEALARRRKPERPAEARYLRGMRIAVVGDNKASVDLRERAERYGAKLAVRVTGTVQWLSTDTPLADDAKHRAARLHGVPLIRVADARKRLDRAIKDADSKAREPAERRAKVDAYWRPEWRAEELDEPKRARGMDD